MNPRRSWFIWFAAGGACAVVAAMAQDALQDSLPPEAKAAFDRGVHAVEVQDWNLATRYFAEARKAAPGAPTVALNLGLAYAKAGKEPLAIAWLNAFAEADPQSPKGIAARAEARRLKAAAKKKLQALFQTAAVAIEQREGEKASDLCWLARSQARAGLLDDALATLARPDMPKTGYYAETIPTEWTANALSDYANTYREAGDPRRAAEALARIKATGIDVARFIGYDYSWAYVSRSFLEQKDFDRAWRAAKQIPALNERGRQMAVVAELRLGEGDFVPAEEAMPLLEEGYDRDSLWGKIAAARLKQKDVRGAWVAARQIRSSYERGWALVQVAEAQFEAGDRAGARATAKEILKFGAIADIENAYEATSGIDSTTAIAAYTVLDDYATAIAVAGGMDVQRNFNRRYYLYNPYDSFAEIIYWQAMNGGDLRGAIRNAQTLAERSTARPKKSKRAERIKADTNQSQSQTLPAWSAIIYGSLAAAQAKLGGVRDAIATAKLHMQHRDLIAWRVAHIAKRADAESERSQADIQIEAAAPAIIYGSLAAAQAKLGMVRDAIATAKLPKQSRGRLAWRVANIVDDLANSGQLAAAVEMADVLRDTGSEGDEHADMETARARAAAALARAQVAGGDLAGAERRAASLGNSRWLPFVWIAIGEGHAKRSANADAVRALAAAALAAANLREDATSDLRGLPPWWWGDKRWYESPWGVTPKEMIFRIAELQASLGDPAAAQAARARFRPTVSGGPWVKLIDDYSFRREMGEIDQSIEQARTSKSPDEIISKLRDAAEKYGKNLVRVEVLEEKLAAGAALAR